MYLRFTHTHIHMVTTRMVPIRTMMAPNGNRWYAPSYILPMTPGAGGGPAGRGGGQHSTTSLHKPSPHVQFSYVQLHPLVISSASISI